MPKRLAAAVVAVTLCGGVSTTPIHRSDSSGTTDNFQKYLTAAAPESWSRGVGTEFQGGVGEGAQRSAGVVQAVQVTPGAIGCVPLPDRVRERLVIAVNAME